MESVCIAKELERLLQFGVQRGLLEPEDVIFTRNALLDLLEIAEPYEGQIPQEELDNAMEVLSVILEYAAEQGIIPENTVGYRDLLDAKIMSLLLPRPSEVSRRFFKTAEKDSIERATDDFYALSQDSNYIRMDRIAKNLYWRSDTEYGELEITINLSKPEKDPKEIAAAKALAQTRYPKCLLCVENVGFAGNLNHPARQNHRVIPLTLSGEQWHFQYSPYVYYNEHCIVFRNEHIPMKIEEDTFKRVFDFVEQFPHYFIGSNADLPIVGGSILTHDHFQGGRHIFPMAQAPVEKEYLHTGIPSVTAGIVKWPMSVIRLSSMDKAELLEAANRILHAWRQYSDVTVDILAFTESTPHNTVTPIARKNSRGELELDLVLRNNRTTEEYPDGIFHPHAHLHHIKKENIGLIEVMGLAVLPGRLQVELGEIQKILTGQMPYDVNLLSDTPNSMLYKHKAWIEQLVSVYGTSVESKQAEAYIHQEVGKKFMDVLLDAGVYKRDEQGKAGFERFMDHLGYTSKR